MALRARRVDAIDCHLQLDRHEVGRSSLSVLLCHRSQAIAVFRLLHACYPAALMPDGCCLLSYVLTVGMS
jgi:hypothetical protein